ncbi:MAG: NAD(P)H-hydrate dehydratase [Mariprofundales bacterium]
MADVIQISCQQVADILPCWEADAHKNSLGHVWIFGGSVGYCGAPQLAAKGAQAMRVGLVSLAVSDAVYPVVATAAPLEVMVHPQGVAPWQGADALVAGPGWGKGQQRMLESLLESDQPLLLDADALNMVAADATLQAKLRARGGQTVMTPHCGEAARLLGCGSAAVAQDRQRALGELVACFDCTVLLKGEGSLIGNAKGVCWRAPFGGNRLATAGSGDVLAGMIGALLAQGIAADNATIAAVALHGLAGQQDGWYRAGQLPDRVFAQAESLRGCGTTAR